MLKRYVCCVIGAFVFSSSASAVEGRSLQIDANSKQILTVPELSTGAPAAGKRIAITPPEYAETDVFHTLYLPENWKKDGPELPIIFEYTGNYFPKAGSTGEPEDGALGYCLCDGKYIWVSLPYISEDGKDNAVTWWGDEQATIRYAKQNVPRIVKEYGADPNAVFLCGFSRGAIGVNYLGLHDDEIAKLWTAFISHDHFDGVRQWGGTTWGSPLDTYRKGAAERLRRVDGRPYFVSQNGGTHDVEEFIRSVLPEAKNFTFNTISAGEIFGEFPNEYVKAAHTDRWLIKPSKYRMATWEWMNETASSGSRPN